MTTNRAPLSERLTLTMRDTAALLGVSERHVRQMVADGVLPSLRLGKRIMVPRAALDAWLAAQTTTPHPAA